MIAEAAVMGNLGNGMVGSAQRNASLVYPEPVDKLHGCHAKITAKNPFKLTHGQIGHVGQILDINPGSIICTDVFDNPTHLVVGFPRCTQPVQVLGDASQANDSLVFRIQGNFVGQVPLHSAVTIGHHFDTVIKGLASVKNLQVILQIIVHKIFRKHICIHQASDLLLFLNTQFVHEKAIARDESALAVLDEKTHIIDMFKELCDAQSLYAKLCDKIGFELLPVHHAIFT